ncbi:cyclodeaminase/cyclohydrolase family protein, partial [bacterium]|nr:cyclodeaminase/cyclohydrolase family protein [bacterium]
TMAECVALAREVGERVGRELDIPVYLYESAATREERRNLAHVRKGEYEALPDKLGTAEWKPDFGPNVWNTHTARTGATNVSARGFLVAYNVNINSRNKSIASQIALDIKEAGRAQRDRDGNTVKGPDGQTVLAPGPYRLEACKAVGWVIPEYDRAQVSINLVNTAVTKPHQAFEACREAARDRDARVTGSELVGLIPESDMLAAGKYYLRRAGQSAGVPRRMLIETAIQSMGLRDIAPFDPAEKIIEYRAGLVDGPLVSLTNRAFVDVLSTDAPAPGGGSVAALGAAQAAALVAMVANLTVGKKTYAESQDRVKEIAERAQAIKDDMLKAIDDDTDAFNAVLDTFRLPRTTDAQARTRDLATAATTRQAISVPLSVLEAMPEVLELAAEVAEIGNANSLSDAGVAALCAGSGAEGAYYNVLINLASLAGLPQDEEPEFVAEVRRRAAAARQHCVDLHAKVRDGVRNRLEAALG